MVNPYANTNVYGVFAKIVWVVVFANTVIERLYAKFAGVMEYASTNSKKEVVLFVVSSVPLANFQSLKTSIPSAGIVSLLPSIAQDARRRV